LHVWECNWEIWQVNDTLARTTAFDRRAVDQALRHLKGQVLSSVDVSIAPLTCSFIFDLGGRLVISPYQDFDDERLGLWTLATNRNARSYTLEETGLLVVESAGAEDARYECEPTEFAV
jgi:hypothetical protein